MDDVYNKAALTEYQRAASEINAEKILQTALKKSYARYEKLIAKTIDESSEKPACKAGCSYCCYYKVEVKAHEVFVIKDHMQKVFSADQIKTLLHNAKENADLIKTLTPEQHLITNIKCAFLLDNKCSIYEARPFKCRNFHSTDLPSCEKSFANPEDLTIESGLVESVAMFGNGHSQAFEAAVEHKGLDIRTYDMNTAILEVFAEPGALKRFNRGKKAFQKAIEVHEDH